MNWKEQVLAAYPHDLQRATRCKMALRELEGALAALSSMGFPLRIEEGLAPLEIPEFPKVVFHLRSGSREVLDQKELEELGSDWYPTMDEARYAAGMTKQMQRGGIFDKSLPMLVEMPLQPQNDRDIERRRQQSELAEKLRQEVRERQIIDTSSSNILDLVKMNGLGKIG